MRMQRRGRRGAGRIGPESIRLNIIALVDVVFLLLLYFIMAGTVAGEEARLGTTLATQGASASAGVRPQRLTVGWVDGAPRWQIGERVLTDRAALRAVLRELPREAGLVVMPDPDAPLEATAGAVQAARDVGFTRISYVTRKRLPR
jgi:biopolymer transport protein ExbD